MPDYNPIHFRKMFAISDNFGSLSHKPSEEYKLPVIIMEEAEWKIACAELEIRTRQRDYWQAERNKLRRDEVDIGSTISGRVAFVIGTDTIYLTVADAERAQVVLGEAIRHAKLAAAPEYGKAKKEEHEN